MTNQIALDKHIPREPSRTAEGLNLDKNAACLYTPLFNGLATTPELGLNGQLFREDGRWNGDRNLR